MSIYTLINEADLASGSLVAGDDFIVYDLSAEIIKRVGADAIATYARTFDSTEVVVAANVLTAGESGKTLILSLAAGFQTTLPAMAAGLHFTFRVGAIELSGNDHTIITNAADTNKMFGSVSAGGTVVLIDTHDTLTLVDQKFLRGDWIDFYCDGSNWYVTGVCSVVVGVSSA